jgi:hypothetical protein
MARYQGPEHRSRASQSRLDTSGTLSCLLAQYTRSLVDGQPTCQVPQRHLHDDASRPRTGARKHDQVIELANMRKRSQLGISVHRPELVDAWTGRRTS